jgi:hypothetical protein
MKLAITLLTAALGLIMSAFPVFAKPVAATATITISSLPYTITAPGTYVLTVNLTSFANSGIIIQPEAAMTGPVVVDLKGFSLIAPNGIGIAISGSGAAVTNAFPITIRNGTVYSLGVAAQAGPTAPLQNILIANLNIYCGGANCGIGFSYVQNSTVRNCMINEAANGIVDDYSPGGNHYSNITLTEVAEDLLVAAETVGQFPSKTVVIEECDYTVH